MTIEVSNNRIRLFVVDYLNLVWTLFQPPHPNNMAHADRPHIKVTSLSLLQCALLHNCVAFGNEKKYKYDSDMTHDGEDQNAEVEDGVTQFLFLFLFCSAPPFFPPALNEKQNMSGSRNIVS